MSDRLDVEPDQEEPSALGAAATLPTGKQRPPRKRRKGAEPPAAAPAPVTSSPRVREYSDLVYTFEPHSSSVPPLRSYLWSLWERRRFASELAKAELRGPRSNTVLGALWGVLDPLLQAMIYYFLVTIIRGGQGGRTEQFLPVLIGGILLFNFTSRAFTEGGRSILKARGLMLNSTFPRALLPIAAVYGALLEFLPSIGVYTVFHIVYNKPVHSGLLFLPLIFLLQIVLSLGMGLLLATITVFVRDAVKVMGYLVRVFLFTSPIIYPVAQIPADIRSFLAWNPLFPLFATYQDIFQGSRPDPVLVLHVGLWAAFFLVVGAWAFLRHERAFAIRL